MKPEVLNLTGPKSYVLQERIALRKIKELEKREKKRKRTESRNWSWNWFKLIPSALFTKLEYVRLQAPGKRALERHEWENSYRILDYHRVL